MKTNLIILFSLICQSLCAQSGPQLSEWPCRGCREIKVYDSPAYTLYCWHQQILTPDSLAECYLTAAPCEDWDKQLEICVWTGSRQTFVSTQTTLIQWRGSQVTTSIVARTTNGRWISGGDCAAWSGTDIEGRPYEMAHWADMAVLWVTNAQTYFRRCYELDDEQSYVLGLYRTNGTTALTGLSDCTVKPGTTNFLVAPEIQGRHNLKFMVTQACRHCGDGCNLAWTMTGKPRNPRITLLAGGSSMLMEFPSSPRRPLWKVEKSRDFRAWNPVKSGSVSLKERLDDALVKVECPIEPGTWFYRVQFSENTLQSAIHEMFEFANQP